MKRVLWFVVVCCLAVGCSKSGKKPSARCIYDQPPIAEACRVAAGEGFETFKLNPYVNLFWENATEEEGRQAMEKVAAEYPFLIEKLSKIQTGDRVGSPRVFDYGEGSLFSPYTLRLTEVVGDMHQRVGDLSGKRVVQIGAGYGGLCKILHDVYSLKGYAIVDLPEQLDLAQKYLETLGITDVEYISVDALQKGEWDLVLSDQAFSEFDGPYQERMIAEVFSGARSGYILGRVFPKHFGVSALDVETIEKKLKKIANFNALYMKIPEYDRGEYFIIWEDSTR